MVILAYPQVLEFTHQISVQSFSDSLICLELQRALRLGSHKRLKTVAVIYALEFGSVKKDSHQQQNIYHVKNGTEWKDDKLFQPYMILSRSFWQTSKTRKERNA